MNTYVYLWYLAEFFSEFEMFQIKVVEEIKILFMSSNFFIQQVVLFVR